MMASMLNDIDPEPNVAMFRTGCCFGIPFAGARELKVLKPEDCSDSNRDITANRKYDDTNTDHRKRPDADDAVESTNRNTTFDSGIGVDWSKMINVGSLCEHVTGSWVSLNDPDDVKSQS
ncbi:hypothetical protein LSH36_224g01003 [Paralvinella palmiformis]|uniref:Uncharacterized protein n=1 Tax=Paralvinella palmiformis TaxID=53620 RepID=A0AAD9JNH4_9ANNE|nr:hypothetical protein LSH36_224g01003 [Paralvinella palmiformis]